MVREFTVCYDTLQNKKGKPRALTVTFRDSVSQINVSLRAACKAFDTEIVKGHLCHPFVTLKRWLTDADDRGNPALYAAHCPGEYRFGYK